jgi:hypothetical protein
VGGVGAGVGRGEPGVEWRKPDGGRRAGAGTWETAGGESAADFVAELREIVPDALGLIGLAVCEVFEATPEGFQLCVERTGLFVLTAE